MPALHVRLEVAGVERQVHLPRARRLLVLLELAVDPRQVEQRLPVARAQPHDLLVLRGRAPQRCLRVGSGRLDLLELRQHQVRVGVVRVERDRRLGLLQGLVERPISRSRRDVSTRIADADGSSFCARRYAASASSTLPASRSCSPRLYW